MAADLQFLVAHRIACDCCTDEPVPGPGKEEHSNILLVHYLVVVVRAGFGRWVSINDFLQVSRRWVRLGHVLTGGCHPDYFQE